MAATEQLTGRGEAPARPAPAAHPPDEAGFRAWATSRGPGLRRTAYLLTLNWHDADDAVQDTLTKVFARWRGLARDGSPDAYARRVLATTVVDQHRRPWRRERVTDDVISLVDRAVDTTPALPGRPDRDELIHALQAVPVGQRAVLVLRFWDDQSVEQVADLLGISTGTVKSQTARGLARLRRELGLPQVARRGGDPSTMLTPSEESR